MATVMTWETSGGSKGRCDDKCHSAKEPKCVCMCGGRYHGVANKPGGLDQARKEFGEEILKDAERRAREGNLQLQASLF